MTNYTEARLGAARRGSARRGMARTHRAAMPCVL